MGECLIRRRGGEVYRLPVLNGSYPKDVTTKASASGTVSFSISISKNGKPAEYTYQWYVNGSAVSGATSASYTRSVTSVGTFTVYCAVTNKAGVVNSRTATLKVVTPIPTASAIYSGSCKVVAESTYNWCLYCYGGGTFTYPENAALDVCVVGAGAGGSATNTPQLDRGQPGGGGGTVKNFTYTVTANQSYTFVVGSGGSAGTPNGGMSAGGSSSAFGTTAAGGAVGAGGTGGSGGSAGTAGKAGTRAFGDSNYSYYGGSGGGGGSGSYAAVIGGYAGASGGAGGSGGGGKGASGNSYGDTPANATAGATNTGGGGGGQGGGYKSEIVYGGNAAKGGSGIILVRNAR